MMLDMYCITSTKQCILVMVNKAQTVCVGDLHLSPNICVSKILKFHYGFVWRVNGNGCELKQDVCNVLSFFSHFSSALFTLPLPSFHLSCVKVKLFHC